MIESVNVLASMQMKPTSVPKWNTSNNNSQKVDPLQLLPRGISCPDGTAIVKRTTVQDLLNVQHLKSIGFNRHRHGHTEGNDIDLTGHHVRTLLCSDNDLCFVIVFVLYGY